MSYSKKDFKKVTQDECLMIDSLDFLYERAILSDKEYLDLSEKIRVWIESTTRRMELENIIDRGLGEIE